MDWLQLHYRRILNDLPESLVLNTLFSCTQAGSHGCKLLPFHFYLSHPIRCPLSKLDSSELGLTYSRLRKDIPLDYSQRREGVFIIIPRCIHLSKIMVKSISPSAHLDIIREGYSY